MHRLIPLLGALLTVLPLHASGATTSYPDRPVRIVVPVAAGGTTDLAARIIGQKLNEQLRQPFITDNRPGAGHTLGADIVARAAPDGYTLLLFNVNHTLSSSLYKKLPYDTEKAFAHITPILKASYILVVHPGVKASSVAQLIALAKSRPGKLNYASGGVGTGVHLAGALFASMAGIDMVHVAYKGAGPALSEVMGGQVEMIFAALPTALPHVKSGKVTAIGLTDAGGRNPALPAVSTIAESGLPGYDVVSWFGLSAPAGTPSAIINNLNASVSEALALPDVRQRLDAAGAVPWSTSSATFTTFVASEIKRWGGVIRASGIQAH